MRPTRGQVEDPGRVATLPKEEQDERSHSRALEPYKVVLYNDDVNSMDHVVRSLLRSVPGLSTRKAIEVMMEAHNSGRAIVWSGDRELAELYWEQLNSAGLTMAPLEQG